MRLGKSKKNPGQPYWHTGEAPVTKSIADGWRFSLKGSPRFYDDILAIIESDPDAQVYFGEALTYERGAGVALWRISARSFNWLPELYAWWAEAERVEPVNSTFYLYLPSDPNYPVMDLRQQTPEEVETFVKANAPTSEAEALAMNRTH